MARAASSGGLSEQQLADLRDEVTSGHHPRVRLVGALAGAASAGTVRRVGDPAADGEDFVTVRVKINGVVDDLRFAPRELSRGPQAAAPPAATARSSRRRATTEPKDTASAPSRPAAPPTPRPKRTAPATSPVTPPVSPPAPVAASRPQRKKGRAGAPAAPLTVVLTAVDAAWTVSAQRGSRSLLKNAPVQPGVVSAVAALLGHPAVEEAVGAVNDTARAEAESRAETLRAELAEIQAVLDSHRRPTRRGTSGRTGD